MTSAPEPPATLPRPLDGRRALPLGLGLVVLLLLVFMRRPTTPSDMVHEWSGATMGTTYSVKVDADIEAATREALAIRIEEVLAKVNALMSTYDTASEISRFNRYGGVEPFRISREVAEVLVLAVEIGRRSDGRFDVTVGPLVDAWGFGPGESPDPPDHAAIDTLLGQVGQHGLVLDTLAGTVRKLHPGLGIDLSAIAKGYAVDLLAAVLDSTGLTRHLVEVGGELRAGAPRRDGGGWLVGVERPEPDTRRLHARFRLDGQAIATSGDYRNFRGAGDERRAHLIDPRTGAAIGFTGMSVSVVDTSTAVADAWATALAVAGIESGYALAVREDVAALFLRAAGDGIEARATPRFAERATAYEEVGR